MALAVLALFSVWITWRAKTIELGTNALNAASPLVGKPAPDFVVDTLDGRKLALADYRGKTLVVTFWASWCGPCRMELPVLARFYRRTHQPDSDFEILAISTDDSRDAAANEAKALNLPFPVAVDVGNRIASAYNIESIPMLFVTGKSGTLIYSHVGFEMTLDIMLAQQLGIQNYTQAVGVEK